MIYIDPPYNTGKEFIYPDKFQENLSTYLKYTGQVDDEGMKFSSNTETTGRKHSAWLSMMYPRLKLAKNLLQREGVIFISIDDNEVANLREICDEIFGEPNFLGCAGRVTKKSNNKGDFWAPNFDYVLTYAKDVNETVKFFGGVNYDAYKEIDYNGPRTGEKYQLVRMYMSSIENRNPDQRFYIECPDGTRVIPPGETFPPERPKLGDGIWRWTKKKMEENKDSIVIKRVKSSNLITEDGSVAKWNVYTKTYLSDVIANASAKPNSLIEGHINQIGSHELNELEIPFDFSKPSTLVQYLIQISRTEKDDIVLDFFAGSGTTAQSVMKQNSIDSGCRKFILVQLPEKIDPKKSAHSLGYETLADLAKERIRRIGNKISSQASNSLDVGFKVLKLSNSNIKAWCSERNNLEQSLLSHEEHLIEGRTEKDILYELLLKRGIDLTVQIKIREITGRTIYSIGYGVLFACLDETISKDQVEDLGQGIVDWYQELAPSSDSHVFFRDSAFSDDVSKTNMVAILEQNGITHVRSL